MSSPIRRGFTYGVVDLTSTTSVPRRDLQKSSSRSSRRSRSYPGKIRLCRFRSQRRAFLAPEDFLWEAIAAFLRRNAIRRPARCPLTSVPSKFPTPLFTLLLTTRFPFLWCLLISAFFVTQWVLSDPLFAFTRPLPNKATSQWDKGTDGNESLSKHDPAYSWTGKIVNQTGQGLEHELAKLYMHNPNGPLVLADTSRGDGTIQFSQISTGVGDGGNLPDAYAISNVYPQPFNPHAYVNVSMPSSGKIKANVFNIVGQKVRAVEQDVNKPGVVPVKLDLEGLAQGVYFANVVVSDRNGKEAYHETKKLMYLAGSQHASQPSRLILPRGTMSLSKAMTDATIDSLVVSGDNIVKKVFTNPLWVNLPDNYDFGNLTVDQINKLIVGPVYDLDTKFNPEGKHGIKGMKAFLGSEPGNSALTDSLGMATLYTIKVGKDSVFVIDTAATDTTGFYNWKNPELQIINGDNTVKHFHEDSGIPTKHRGKDRNGEDYLEFVQRITGVIGQWGNPPDPVYFQTVPRFNYEDLPNNEVKIFFNRQALPDWIRFYDEHLRLDSIPKSVYVDSLLKGAKTQDRARQKFVETLDSTNAQIIVEHDNFNLGNVVELRYDRDSKGPYAKLVRIKLRGPPNSGFIPPKGLPYAMAHEIERAGFTFIGDGLTMDDLIYIGVGERYDAGIRDFGSKKELWAQNFILDLDRNATKLFYWFK
jgi:hypothetical protein